VCTEPNSSNCKIGMYWITRMGTFLSHFSCILVTRVLDIGEGYMISDPYE
jgi:hypothetical protein